MVHALNIIYPKHRVVAVPLEGSFDRVELVDDFWDGGNIPSSNMGGRPVKPELVPKRMRWTKGGKLKIPDFEMSGSHVGVSDHAKSLIEQFEPGIHQFVPTDYFSGRGELLERRYILFVCNRIDSLDHDKTSFVLNTFHVLPGYSKPGKEWGRSWVPVSDLVRRGETDKIPKHLPHNTRSKFVFNRAKVGTHHMWCDKFIDHAAWISDELALAIRDSKLSGINLKDDASGMETV